MKFSDLLAKLTEIKGLSHSLTDYPEYDPELKGISAIKNAQVGTISYIEGKEYESFLETTPASALVLPLNSVYQQRAIDRKIAWIAHENPRLLFAMVLDQYYQCFKPAPQIHPTAVIDPTAQIGEDVSIGAYVVIEKGVKIADRVVIHPHVVLYPDVSIGSDTVIHAHVSIQERTQIGKNCIIQNGAVLGAEGFGFVPTAEGWYKMPQSGYVVLADGVEVGCNSTIDRPSVGETFIGEQTKIDNLVHIGHGCTIGKACALAGQVGLAGAVTLGNRVILAGQAGIANQAIIGDGVIASAQSGITSNVKAGMTVTGSPAYDHKQSMKALAVARRLPEMYQFYKELKKERRT